MSNFASDDSYSDDKAAIHKLVFLEKSMILVNGSRQKHYALPRALHYNWGERLSLFLNMVLVVGIYSKTRIGLLYGKLLRGNIRKNGIFLNQSSWILTEGGQGSRCQTGPARGLRVKNLPGQI